MTVVPHMQEEQVIEHPICSTFYVTQWISAEILFIESFHTVRHYVVELTEIKTVLVDVEVIHTKKLSRGQTNAKLWHSFHSNFFFISISTNKCSQASDWDNICSRELDVRIPETLSSKLQLLKLLQPFMKPTQTNEKAVGSVGPKSIKNRLQRLPWFLHITHAQFFSKVLAEFVFSNPVSTLNNNLESIFDLKVLIKEDCYSRHCKHSPAWCFHQISRLSCHTSCGTWWS